MWMIATFVTTTVLNAIVGVLNILSGNYWLVLVSIGGIIIPLLPWNDYGWLLLRRFMLWRKPRLYGTIEDTAFGFDVNAERFENPSYNPIRIEISHMRARKTDSIKFSSQTIFYRSLILWFRDETEMIAYRMMCEDDNITFVSD